MTELERRLRRLMMLYPKAYRSERGPEIMATVLDAADGDRHWPTTAETADLARHALRRRFGLCADQPPGRLLGVAAAGGLYSAALLATFAFVFGEWAPWQSDFDPHHLGLFYTTGAIIYVCWVAAAVAGLDLQRNRNARLAALGGWKWPAWGEVGEVPARSVIRTAVSGTRNYRTRYDVGRAGGVPQ